MTEAPFPPLKLGRKNQNHALRLALAYCVTDGKPRSPKGSAAKLRAAIKREGGKPLAMATLYRWLQCGVLLDGYPELAQPFDQLAIEVDNNRIDINRWRAGTQLGDALTRAVHDDALLLLQELMQKDTYQVIIAEKPELHLQAMARLTEAVKARGDTGSGDLWQMLDELEEEDGEKVIAKLFEKWPALMEKVEKAFKEDEE